MLHKFNFIDQLLCCRISKKGVVSFIAVIGFNVFSSTSSYCAVYTRTPAMYVDVELKKGASYRQAIPAGFNSMFCVVHSCFLVCVYLYLWLALFISSSSYSAVFLYSIFLNFKFLSFFRFFMMLRGT